MSVKRILLGSVAALAVAGVIGGVVASGAIGSAGVENSVAGATVGDAPWLVTLDSNRGRAGVYGPADRGFPEDGILAEGADAAGWLWADLDPARLDLVREDGGVRNHRDWPPGWSGQGPAAVVETQQFEDA